jgi:hypothetical protein
MRIVASAELSRFLIGSSFRTLHPEGRFRFSATGNGIQIIAFIRAGRAVSWQSFIIDEGLVLYWQTLLQGCLFRFALVAR